MAGSEVEATSSGFLRGFSSIDSPARGMLIVDCSWNVTIVDEVRGTATRVADHPFTHSTHVTPSSPTHHHIDSDATVTIMPASAKAAAPPAQQQQKAKKDEEKRFGGILGILKMFAIYWVVTYVADG